MTDNTAQTTAGGRLSGYGRTVKRLNHHMKATESHVVMRAQATGMPAARLLVRVGLLSAAITLLLGVLLVAFWLFLAIAPVVVFALIVYFSTAVGLGDTQKESLPDYVGADLYAGHHDQNGNCIAAGKTNPDH